MRFPNDTNFHLRMAALVIGSLLIEQLANRHLPDWGSPQIGVITFVVGMLWVALFAAHHSYAMQQKVRRLEEKLEHVSELTESLADDTRQRRSLPPL